MKFDSRTVNVGCAINTVSLGQRFLRWFPSSPVRINAPRLAVFRRCCGNSAPEIVGEQHTWRCGFAYTYEFTPGTLLYRVFYSWILANISCALLICPINVPSISHSCSYFVSVIPIAYCECYKLCFSLTRNFLHSPPYVLLAGITQSV
jgi:hypothetical protein